MNIEQCSPQIQDAFDVFLLDAESCRFTDATLKFYRQRLGRFIRWSYDENVRHLDEISSTHIRKYLVHLQRKGLGGHSQHATARAIKTFLNFCIREETMQEVA